MSSLRDALKGDVGALLKMVLGKPKSGTLPAAEYLALVTDKMPPIHGRPMPGTWLMVCVKVEEAKASG